jgi:OOP family OmpA-OmpF porin
LLAGVGRIAVDSDSMGKDGDQAGYFGGGVKIPFSDFAMVRIDLRDSLSSTRDGGPQPHHFEALLGLSVNLFGSHRDSDDDGIINLDDDCPRTPGPKPTGCPAGDSDKDGFADDVDKCPTEPGVAPDGCPVRDSDGDGFMDPDDACPTEPGVAPSGCPIRDTDGDGFLDPDDKCPTEAGVAPDGCPIRDTDGDGIMDPNDKCVNEPETDNGFEDDDGCPDELPEAIKKFSGVIEGIEFDVGKATIRPGSRPVLDGAIKVLKDYPSLRLAITGHTDNRGTQELNTTLSQDRAAAVRQYMVDQGIPEDRLESKGLGPDMPIADNKTEAGRQKNRRIEFAVIKGGHAPKAAPEAAEPPADAAE